MDAALETRDWRRGPVRRRGPELGEGNEMREWLTRLWEAGGDLRAEESGQDLVEYAIVAALIALGATASMGVIAKSINDIFSSIAVKFRVAAP